MSQWGFYTSTVWTVAGNQSTDFIYCCCWAVIFRYACWNLVVHRHVILVSKTVLKNVCVYVCVLLEWLWGSTWAWHRCAPMYTKALTMTVSTNTSGPREIHHRLFQSARAAPHQQGALLLAHWVMVQTVSNAWISCSAITAWWMMIVEGKIHLNHL